MNYTRRYIPIKCLQKDKKFIPFWLLNYCDNEESGEGFYEKGYSEYEATAALKDCYWDSKKKKVILGIVKDVYPEPTRVEFSIDEEVLSEVTHNAYRINTVVGIEYTDYDTHTKKVSDMDKWELNFFTEEEQKTLVASQLYEFRTWKPYYRLKTGELIKYDFYLKKLLK